MNIRAAGMQPAGSNGDGNPSGGTHLGPTSDLSTLTPHKKSSATRFWACVLYFQITSRWRAPPWPQCLHAKLYLFIYLFLLFKYLEKKKFSLKLITTLYERMRRTNLLTLNEKKIKYKL